MTPALPKPVVEYLASSAIEAAAAAYLEFDLSGHLLRSGGPTDHYGLHDLLPGAPLEGDLAFLSGLVPFEGEPLHLPNLSLTPGVSADAHLFVDGTSTWVLLLDSTTEYRHQAEMQQRLYDLTLQESQPDVLTELGVFALEYTPASTFSLVGTVPNWVGDLFPGLIRPDAPIRLQDRSIFLTHFLEDARHFWDAHTSGTLPSGTWEEQTPYGTVTLEAVALRSEDRRLLLLAQPGRHLREMQRLLQTARDKQLAHHRLRKDIEKKEILLHCIVHDLSSPLSGIQAALSLLNTEPLSPEGRELLKLSTMQSNKLAVFIREILDAFSSEVQPFDPDAFDPRQAPDVADLANQVLKALKPTSVLHQVNFNLDPAPTATPYRVRAETSRLERVLFNLIENALWHSPANGTITVTIAPHDTFVRTTVQDEGPGVPDDLRNDLFEKFVRGNGHGGKLGLGLYFCRISVERWGGQIGYDPRPEGGSIFWFDLPWVPPSDAAHPSGPASAAPPL